MLHRTQSVQALGVPEGVGTAGRSIDDIDPACEASVATMLPIKKNTRL